MFCLAVTTSSKLLKIGCWKCWKSAKFQFFSPNMQKSEDIYSKPSWFDETQYNTHVRKVLACCINVLRRYSRKSKSDNALFNTELPYGFSTSDAYGGLFQDFWYFYGSVFWNFMAIVYLWVENFEFCYIYGSAFWQFSIFMGRVLERQPSTPVSFRTKCPPPPGNRTHIEMVAKLINWGVCSYIFWNSP